MLEKQKEGRKQRREEGEEKNGKDQITEGETKG
jgi:hypothetical protein